MVSKSGVRLFKSRDKGIQNEDSQKKDEPLPLFSPELRGEEEEMKEGFVEGS